VKSAVWVIIKVTFTTLSPSPTRTNHWPLRAIFSPTSYTLQNVPYDGLGFLRDSPYSLSPFHLVHFPPLDSSVTATDGIQMKGYLG
jgi:hypothetical protein